MIRKKVKVTYVDPGAGHWGMHDGWGGWPTKDFHRIFGVLLCKKHWTIPKKGYSSWASAYYFTCTKCEVARHYDFRRASVLKERAKGRTIRIAEYCDNKAKSSLYIKELKTPYDCKTSDLPYKENPFLALAKKKKDSQ